MNLVSVGREEIVHFVSQARLAQKFRSVMLSPHRHRKIRFARFPR